MHVFFHDVSVFLDHLTDVEFKALAIALLLQALRLAVRTRAWRNIIAAAYPHTPVRWRSVLGAYLGGVGLNAITPACSGDVLKLFLVKHRVEGSTYPTLGATLVVETLFDAAVGIGLLIWASTLGVLPNIHSLPDLPNIDVRWVFEHPRYLGTIALVLGIAIGALLVWATQHVRAFWARVGQGFAILRDAPGYFQHVVLWQALSFVLRIATIYWMLRAFHLRRRSTTRCLCRSRRASRRSCRSRPAARARSRGSCSTCSAARPRGRRCSRSASGCTSRSSSSTSRSASSRS